MKRLIQVLLLMALVASLPAAAMSTQEEVQIGAQAAAKFEKQYGLVKDAAYLNRLQTLANRMRPYLKRKDLPWRFSVLNVKEFNAAAFPGGFVYATKGIMDGLTDDELAFALGHEMGHVEYRHSVKELERAQTRKIGIFAIVAAATGGKINNSTANLIGLADTVISSQYSQADEAQADRYGMQLMAVAGFDPVFSLAALQKLAAHGGGGTPGFLNTLVGSHPLTKDRIAQGVKLIPSIPYRVEDTRLPESKPQSAESTLVLDASRTLEYTLSLLGYRHSLTIQRQTEAFALANANIPAGLKTIRIEGAKSEGYTVLEDRLLAAPEIRARSKQAFGAVVIGRGSNTIEAVVLLKEEN